MCGAAIVVVGIGCASTGPNVKHDSKFLTHSPPPCGDSVTTFYALGDWGTGTERQMLVAEALRIEIDALSTERAAPPFVVGLGDNVYEHGLVSGWGNKQTDVLLEQTFGTPYSSLVWGGEPVHFYIVPGNHDYAAGGTQARDGNYGDVIHQEATAEGYYENFHYYPLSYPGKPDGNDSTEYNHIRDRASSLDQLHPLPEHMTRPEVVPTPKGAPVTIIAIDTQALIERQKTEGDPVNDSSWVVLESLLAASDQTWKFVIGHHPVETYSGHGSYRSTENWLWTGTKGRVKGTINVIRLALLAGGIAVAAFVSPAGWIAAGVALALPAGTVVYDKIEKRQQDTDHWTYKAFADSLENILARHGAIYLAGHDHSLQLIEVSGRTIQVVSGSAGKLGWVAESAPELHYSAAKAGFVRLDATHDRLWMQFCIVDEESERPTGAADCGHVFEMSRRTE